MRLTKRKALELCIELWTWLAKHPGNEKDDWPRLMCNEGDIPDMANDCPCCGYAYPKGDCVDDSCPHCPLKDYWPGGSCEPRNTVALSPWREWVSAMADSDMPTVVKAAKAIARLARKALKDHNKRYPPIAEGDT